MQIKNWHVLTDNVSRVYFYGDDWNTDPDYEKFTEIPKEDWIAEDYAVISGAMLEDQNHHSFCDFPDHLNKWLTDAAVTLKQQKDIMQSFCEFVERK